MTDDMIVIPVIVIFLGLYVDLDPQTNFLDGFVYNLVSERSVPCWKLINVQCGCI